MFVYVTYKNHHQKVTTKNLETRKIILNKNRRSRLPVLQLIITKLTKLELSTVSLQLARDVLS